MRRNICIFVSLLLVLHAVCGWQPGLRHVQSKLFKRNKTWKEAQSFCRKNYTDLVTIENEKEDQYFGSSLGWIGLYREDDGSPWKWSNGGQNATFFSWGTEEPKQNQNKHCVWKYNGKWLSRDCTSPRWATCYEENLVLVKEDKTWEEALDHCRSLGRKNSNNPASVFWKPSNDLVTLITDDDHDYARERAQQATTEEVWTGLRFLGDAWFWVGGEPVQYQDIPSCPAFGCGVLEKNSNKSFEIRACSQRRNFFCYKRPPVNNS